MQVSNRKPQFGPLNGITGHVLFPGDNGGLGSLNRDLKSGSFVGIYIQKEFQKILKGKS